MASISTASIVRSAVDDLLATRYRQETSTDYRHRPEVIRVIVADELTALQQRRTVQHQQQH